MLATSSVATNTDHATKFMFNYEGGGQLEMKEKIGDWICDSVKVILRRLWNKKRIGNKHTEEIHVLRWLGHSGEQKTALKDYEQCVKQGLILRVKKTNQFHISLNPKRLKEILEIIQ